MVLDSSGNIVVLRPKPDKSGGGNGKGGGNGGGDDGGDENLEPTADVNGAPWPAPDDPVTDIVGKVLFTLGNTDYVCSASTVAPAAGRGG